MHATSLHSRRHTLRLLNAAAVLALGPFMAAAQPGQRIWRCGNHYTDQPCATGREIAPAERPTDDARADADAATRRTREQADAMARERERLESVAARRGPAVIEHRSPWPPQDDDEEERGRMKRLKRPKTKKGRLPKNENFTARGPRAAPRESAR